MTDKENNVRTESVNPVDLPVTDSNEAEGSRKEKKKSRHAKDSRDEEIAKLREEYAALNDKFLRLYSDFENYRKRTTRERLELMKTASEEVITALLPVLDDFDRALKTIEGRTEEDPVAEGIRLIHNKMNNVLIQKGLQPMEALGQAFDTDFHEAITHIPAPEEGLKAKVIDVTQKGYTLGGKVIRYAKVVVGA
jgi:molecular chaperone GrpE